MGISGTCRIKSTSRRRGKIGSVSSTAQAEAQAQAQAPMAESGQSPTFHQLFACGLSASREASDNKTLLNPACHRDVRSKIKVNPGLRPEERQALFAQVQG
ncbi:hypothetical protein TWF970_004317 [Orbilia oligospora]|uniref:Uncharacterized protein n=1 Tax=Orbilia oligospora TaxID=2813651 RepID=A0A7C8RA86_ORBOL|nr:hypothetical protein TWF970_004317 [Orbilia oligospora]